ncbi:MAG: tetratricopeptide repeat protein [Magnetospiraceae bacterium]
MNDYRQALEKGDAPAAVAIAKKAAEDGESMFQHDLAGYYSSGTGVDQDMGKAVHWLTKAASQGHEEAQKKLAAIYFQGRGVEKDPVQTYLWMGLVAARGSPSGARAMEQLIGTMTPDQLEAGKALLRDWLPEDVQLEPIEPIEKDFTAAAKAKDFETAIGFLQTSAEQGNLRSQFRLGIYYMDGKGTDRDMAKAAHWIEIAANRGHLGSQFNLVLMYERGDGVEKDIGKAYHWALIAAAVGDIDATLNGLRIAENLDPEIKQASKKSAAEWLSRWKWK